MEQERKALRIGLTLILFAAVFRLAGGLWQPAKALLRSPEAAAFVLYLETGRKLTLPTLNASTTSAATTTPPTAPIPPVPETSTLRFSEADGQLLSVTDMGSLSADLTALLLTDLSWDLTGDEPTVLILHTHATESYTKGSHSYQESSAYRTLDEGYNMLGVGDRLAAALETRGITVLHDRTLHDYPSYNGSYNNSRKTAQKYLQEYPSIRVILDLHRDALSLSGGNQMDTSATVDGKASAQLMIVVGSSAGGLHHPNWQENLAFAAKLHVALEKRYPGITRPLNFRSERFNQDLLPGALLIEVGAAGDSPEEAWVAAEALAQALSDLAHGAG